MLSYLNRIKNPASIFIINVFKQIQYYYSIFIMNNQESYQLLIQMENIKRMINNLSIRINTIEDIVRNTRDTQINTIPNITQNHNLNQMRQAPLNSNQQQTFERYVNPLFSNRLFEPNTPSHPTSTPTPRDSVFPTNQDRYYTSNITDTTNLRRTPIRRQPSSRTNPITTNIANNTANNIASNTNATDLSESRWLNNFPTSLNQPHVTRSYNSDGSLDTVEMTFTNVVDPNDLNRLFQNSSFNNTSPTQNRRTRSSRLINSPEDARVFLNLLNALSSNPTRQTEPRISVHDINRHTTVSSYIPTPLLEGEESEGNESDENVRTNDICAICRAPFEEGDITRTLNNCSHYFHCSCIDNWLEIRHSCPSCRHVITQPRIIENNSPTEPVVNLENNLNTVNGLD